MRFRVRCVPVILIAAALRVNAEPAIWVVRQNEATVYLVGTVHLLRHQDDWDKNRLEKVLAESRELWLEVADFDDPGAALSLLEKYGFDQDKPLSSKLDAKQKDKLDKVAAQFGVSASILEPMQPWMANIRWSAKIVELLKSPGIKLVAVGAGHLVGPDSVQAQLLKLGIKAEQF